MPGPSLRVLSHSLLGPLSPNHQSRFVLSPVVVGPPWTLADRGRYGPGISPHITIIKTGKSVICSGGWVLKFHARPI
jgi:hypothetical protein